MKIVSTLVCAAALLALPPPSHADASEAPGAQIAWHGTWAAGLAEARRTGRPILLVAAAPHCHGVSGIW